MLTCMRWYLAYPLSLRYIDEMMQGARCFRWLRQSAPLFHQGAAGNGGNFSS